MRREIPFPTQKRKANESHKQSIDQRPNKGTVPDPEAYPKDADYLYLRLFEGARAPHCLVLEAGVGGYVTDSEHDEEYNSTWPNPVMMPPEGDDMHPPQWGICGQHPREGWELKNTLTRRYLRF